MYIWYSCDISTLLLFISNHVGDGLYKPLAICATKHMFVMTCAVQKNVTELPDGWFVMDECQEA